MNDFRPVIARKVRKKRKTEQTYNENLVSEDHKKNFLGKLLLGTTSNVFPEEFKNVTMVFKRGLHDVKDCLVLRYDKISVIVELILDTEFVQDVLLSHKVLAVSFSSCNEDVYLHLYLKQLPIQNKLPMRTSNCLINVFSMLFGGHNISMLEESTDKELYGHKEINEVFNQIKMLQADRERYSQDVQHTCLRPLLRPYQQEGVRWMLEMEKVHEPKVYLDPLYNEVTLPMGQTIYYDKYRGLVETEKPEITTTQQRGGILADEMGLGKTVQVLAAILLNPLYPNVSVITEGISPKAKKAKRVKPLEAPSEPKVRNLSPEPKPSSSRGINRIALQNWYKDALNEVAIKRKERICKENLIQCVCGVEMPTKDLEECVRCHIKQHGNCLNYSKKSGGDFICSQCWQSEPLLESKATLIVTPSALQKQWCTEIAKHIKDSSLAVLQYEGYQCAPVYPTDLQNYDVVITTYNVLQSELKLTSISDQSCKFRRKRKYANHGSPLVLLKWWRLCLDEAQIVDSPARMVSAMAQKITAEIRWAVTGTPISKDIADLYGLINFLQIEPYNHNDTWKHLLYLPFVNGDSKPLCKFLSKILWRTSKVDVLNQINIPKQSFKNHVLEFSAIERFYYKLEHELCTNEFLKKLNNCSVAPDCQLTKIDKSFLKKLLIPLLNIRQACIHPNTVRGRYLATKKPVTSMKELLEVLILKNMTNCEDSLRIVVSSLNGLAGICLLTDANEEAVGYYRRVLQLKAQFSGDNEDDADKLTIDKLQIIHAMHNLAELFERFEPKDKTLRDDSLRQDCALLEKKYIEKYHKETSTAYNEAQTYETALENLWKMFLLKPGQWYSDSLAHLYTYGHYDDLMNRAETILNKCSISFPDASRLPSERELLKMLALWDEAINDYRNDLTVALEAIFKCNAEPSSEESNITLKPDVVQKAMECHLRPEEQSSSKSKKKVCPICAANNKLRIYEGKLFRMEQRKVTTEEDMALIGSWQPTLEEIVFRSLVATIKIKCADKVEWIKDGETYINVLENLKKEFKSTRKFWTYLDQQVCAEDELSICKIRLQIKDPNSKDEVARNNGSRKELKHLSYALENKSQHLHMLESHELYDQKFILQQEEKVNMIELQQNLGIQRYLKTLRKQQFEGQKPDPCPICKNDLEHHWTILACGHTYCLTCIQTLLGKPNSKYIQCCVCRNRQNINDISYIKLDATDSEDSDTNLKGKYSTKIEAIVRLLLDLKTAQPKVKVLIFSSWLNVLKCLREAITSNRIICELATSADIEKRIGKFKDPSENITALLLPIALGSKGLNLIEATHVLLVEPLLNPADELQAIGRVHRIGQTKETVVHKFLIKNTIEENIHQATAANADSWDKNKVTLRQLRDLFEEQRDN